MELDGFILAAREAELARRESIRRYQGTEQQKRDIEERRRVPTAVEKLLSSQQGAVVSEEQGYFEFPIKPASEPDRAKSDPKPAKPQPKFSQYLRIHSPFLAEVEGVIHRTELELILVDGSNEYAHPLGRVLDNSDTDHWDAYGRPRNFGFEVPDQASVMDGHIQYIPATLKDVEKIMGAINEAAELQGIQL